MTETIIINENPVRLSAGAGALIHYKKQFQTEYIEDYKCLQDAPAELRIEKIAGIGMQLLWAMAKAADKSLPPYIEWILQFDAAELASATQAAEALFISSLGKGSETSRSGGREFTAENLIAFSLACGLSVSDLDDMPLPMVIDTFDEWCRIKGYKEEEARPATQEDFDAL